MCIRIVNKHCNYCTYTNIVCREVNLPIHKASNASGLQAPKALWLCLCAMRSITESKFARYDQWVKFIEICDSCMGYIGIPPMYHPLHSTTTDTKHFDTSMMDSH